MSSSPVRPPRSTRCRWAYYALLLDSALRELASPLTVDPLGEVLRQPDPGSGDTYTSELFPLKGYRAQVVEFFHRQLPRLATVRVDAERDDTFFHLYFKCEQCPYLPHCRRAIDPSRPSGEWDVSAVAGLSQQTKRTLLGLGVATVADLAAADDLRQRGTQLNWSLRSNADQLQARAAALADGGPPAAAGPVHPPGAPRGVDLAIYLLVDHDPVEGRLAALGCLCERTGAAGPRHAFRIAPIAEAGDEPERAALTGVLGAALAELGEADAHNRDHPSDPCYAHVFVYESSEAVDLQRALGPPLAVGRRARAVAAGRADVSSRGRAARARVSGRQPPAGHGPPPGGRGPVRRPPQPSATTWPRWPRPWVGRTRRLRHSGRCSRPG